jgi:hypothetical protein
MVDTPHEYTIRWRTTPTGGEGTSHFGRYIHTRHEDGTQTVEFIGKGRSEALGARLSDFKAYERSVEHNKELLRTAGLLGRTGESEPGPTRRPRQDQPVCPKCQMTHPPGECPW